MNIAYNIDCMEYMQSLPDKAFDLAVADPPYGINRFKHGETSRLRKYGQLGTVNDNRPTKDWFEQLRRVSQNQIIFGYNHLCDILPPTSEFLFWYKHQPVDTYADGELIYTSFSKTAKCFDYPFFGGTGADKDGRIHPTQKPVAIYAWIYSRYAKSGDKILDTHLGSGSSRIAAYDAGLDFVGCEIDTGYFAAQEKRFQEHISQENLFLQLEQLNILEKTAQNTPERLEGQQN